MKKLFLIILVTFISLAPVRASHLMGGEITWTCITNPANGPVGLYIFTLKCIEIVMELLSEEQHKL